MLKEKLKKVGSKVAGFFTGAAVMVGSTVTALAAEGTNEGVSAAKSLLAEAQKGLNITTVVEIIGAGIGAVLLFFVAWWGARKLVNMLIGVFKKGKVKI